GIQQGVATTILDVATPTPAVNIVQSVLEESTPVHMIDSFAEMTSRQEDGVETAWRKLTQPEMGFFYEKTPFPNAGNMSIYDFILSGNSERTFGRNEN